MTCFSLVWFDVLLTFLALALRWSRLRDCAGKISVSCLTSKTQFRTPNFLGSVDSAAMIQTSTPNAMKCLISFPNVAILTTSYLKHSLVSKTSIDSRESVLKPSALNNKERSLSHLLSTVAI